MKLTCSRCGAEFERDNEFSLLGYKQCYSYVRYSQNMELMPKFCCYCGHEFSGEWAKTEVTT